MDFSMDMMLAIKLMLRLLDGKVEAPRPSWCNFTFFHRIEAGAVREIEGAHGRRLLERDITFYILDNPVAIVTMRGLTDASGEPQGWGHYRLVYMEHYDSAYEYSRQSSRGRRDVTFDTISFISFKMPTHTSA